MGPFESGTLPRLVSGKSLRSVVPKMLSSQFCANQPRRLFLGLWLFIILVSVIDGYLVVEHRSQIMRTELNPFGRGLLILNGGGIVYLLAAKFFGTVTACAILLTIYERRRRLGLAIAAVLAVLQFCLLLFLTLA